MRGFVTVVFLALALLSYFPLEERASVFQVTSGPNTGNQQTKVLASR